MMPKMYASGDEQYGTFSGFYVAYFTDEVNSSLAKRPLNFNGGLAKLELTSLIKLATDRPIDLTLLMARPPPLLNRQQ